ncbi:hypothetical protein THIAE_09680 [Thiomicrospira aerophila AL3]|uniref:Uncharacterized protein n=1 Tax=Thiomicrospira aerophila AL3 TaxID=717772 RepID=W0DVC5_9GAMM|nr:hypothetical protein [Thiomicrospira aerophila]AHF02397.1 hypothetical protein THIAE_09680 [Thiomicrospira aerophila AL3]
MSEKNVVKNYGHVKGGVERSTSQPEKNTRPVSPPPAPKPNK